MRYRSFLMTTMVALFLGACTERTTEATAEGPDSAAADRPGCDEDNGGITLPSGFCAAVFADNLGHTRHLTVAPGGSVYVNTWSSKYNMMTNAPGGFIVALRDADADGHAETIERFGTVAQEGMAGGGTGIAVHADSLYVEVDDKIVRYPLTRESLVPKGAPETIIGGLPIDGDHPMHPFAISRDGTIFMNSGSATNSCQERNRMLESSGRKPCAELKTNSGIWRFDANRAGQTFTPAGRWATGTRNAVALAINPEDESLYAAMHGRDQLADNWPNRYTKEQNNDLPAEILAKIERGDDYGWPYCYFDPIQMKHVLAPEYGGDGGNLVGECSAKKMPDVVFPAHWAPEAIAFYSGSALPQKYQGGAFVSFHGSWNRTPVQAGFLVAFVPFENGRPSGRYEEFATGFAGVEPPADPMMAAHRPMGLAIGPDGAIYVSDDVKGRIWRIIYIGD